MRVPEVRQVLRQYERKLERALNRDKPRLFQALEQFANIPPDKKGWARFRTRWPKFFPEDEFEKVANGSAISLLNYPYWLGLIWSGGESEPHLNIMLGLDSAPTEGTPEDAWVSDLSTIPAKLYVDWDDGIFRYQSDCDFHKALYLLFQESWRARICENCQLKFIARRAAQKYCSTDCSESILRKLKQKWWAEHGEEWRRQRKESKRKRKGGHNGAPKTR